ncbi:High-affinity nickel-transport protein [Streptoalloteichus tenebrarius]|uniref:High-affinity nickel-transport protein n=1 Tax=Streptoalloteichus tenebrarius (strain ATCC 17920 / DSM 40477 / JCM 4838 / CBS 697.72 / NBRC 16177 / NCIMB 11028 / NRRL B-12390 / A12253. 1 / ISP 5477) TaxID=1933 RepID=A0ABT1HMY1_STRSD|nr:hypothetical protein [Streptoalloteichus tenebrarius]MCP2256872.1 High-affinity nickel-transport protein [Streptoalloteichus tenebrarius]BFF00221.1 hypothetical protein GCM10020241_18960 [Streptoalloteichus tenebrarius]
MTSSDAAPPPTPSGAWPPGERHRLAAVGLLPATGHATVVRVIAPLVAVGSIGEARLAGARQLGALVSLVVAVLLLPLIAVLDAAVLRSPRPLWRQVRRGDLGDAKVDRTVGGRAPLHRLLGGRLRGLTLSSSHMCVTVGGVTAGVGAA